MSESEGENSQAQIDTARKIFFESAAYFNNEKIRKVNPELEESLYEIDPTPCYRADTEKIPLSWTSRPGVAKKGVNYSLRHYGTILIRFKVGNKIRVLNTVGYIFQQGKRAKPICFIDPKHIDNKE